MKNDYGPKSFGSRGFFLSLIALLISTGIAVVLDIPILRQVLGFIYLTFLPGWLIVFILKLNKLGLVEKIVLSWGSVSPFLCSSGAMCQVFGFPRAITLNSEGPLYSSMYVSDEDSYAARWIKEYGKEGEIVYAHSRSTDVLLSQGRIPLSQTDPSLISRYQEGKKIDGYIYLRYVDIVDGGLVAEYPALFTGKSKIYANGGSKVYR